MRIHKPKCTIKFQISCAVFFLSLLKCGSGGFVKADLVPARELKPSSGPYGYLLSNVLKKDLTAFSLQSKQIQTNLKKKAEIYARVRKSGASRSDKNKFVVECATEAKSPFCELSAELNKREEDTAFKAKEGRCIVSPQRRDHVLRWISDGNLEMLNRVPEQQIRQIFKEMNEFSAFNNLIESIHKAPCELSSMSMPIAVKYEEFLPDKDIRKKLIQLYEKASKCNSGENALVAHYRSSLMYLWEEKCDLAKPHLSTIVSQSTDNDFISRSLYWLYQCSRKEQDAVLSSQFRERLLQKHPFSFHALLLRDEGKNSQLPFVLKADSDVQFRSDQNEKLNRRLQAVEVLLEIKEEKLAREAMATLDRDLENEKANLRLYAVVLYNRMNAMGKNFKLLTSIFRDEPNLISQSSLELYYPKKLENFREISKQGLDGLLVLSLIRQESAFNAGAKSPVGALGLMQVMPNTARRYGLLRRSSKLLDPEFNLKVGSRYFSGLLSRFNGDAALAIAAYNAGEKRIDQWVLRYPVKDRVLFMDLIPFKETRKYVSSIARNYFWYSTLYPPKPELKSSLTPNGNASYKNLEKIFRLAGT